MLPPPAATEQADRRLSRPRRPTSPGE
jgi:hypothetical protein